MTIADLNGRTVCLLGFGREGQATLRAIERYAPKAEVTIADRNPQIEATDPKYWRQLGDGWLENLEKFDVIIKSPGIPPQPEFGPVRGKLTNATQIFLETARAAGSTVIGVTGSKGKSTTSTLIHTLLVADKRDTHLVGNIGIPALDYLDRAQLNTIFVQEMSSYQLADLTISPPIAVVTSFFPEHLDYHGTLDAYREAKTHITRFQEAEDAVYYNARFPDCRSIADCSPGTRVPYTGDDSLVAIADTHLIGAHNQDNIAGACLVARRFGVPDETCRSVIRDFRGLPHRLQSLGTHHNAEWIDDAISTTPESAIAALDALGDSVRVMILGGQDRGNDFTALGRRIATSGVRDVILFPGSGPRIRTAIEATGAAVTFHEAGSMAEAVASAKEMIAATVETPLLRQAQDDRGVSTGTIVLLSTASPSYGMFKNFEEKGDAFRECISR